MPIKILFAKSPILHLPTLLFGDKVVPTVLRSIWMNASSTSKNRSLPTGAELGVPNCFPFKSE